MRGNKTNSVTSGAIEVLQELRKSQVAPPPLSRLDKHISEAKKSFQEDIEAENATNNLNIIHEIEPSLIDRWIYKDRPENELGDVDELAQTFLNIGQQQPCIVRPSKTDPKRYELIVGERRWQAAKRVGLLLKVIIQDLDDRLAALVQAIENEQRKDLTEFAKGMSYADKIEKGLLAQKDLTEILKISRQQVSRLLSYRNIPPTLFEAISDFRLVSSRTAYELSRLANKNEEYLNALIELADKIREGKIGANSIEKLVKNKLVVASNSMSSNKKVTSIDGRHLFTWRLDNNKTPSIHFPQEIVSLIEEQKIDFDTLTNDFINSIIKQLSELSLSPRGDKRETKRETENVVS